MVLEDEGRFKEAEAEFINAKKPKEAIDMYVHQQDWKSALRIAENYDRASQTEVRLAQARAAVDKKDYASAESIFAEVGKADVAVKMYKDARMWEDALRVAKTHESAPVEILINHLYSGSIYSRCSWALTCENYASGHRFCHSVPAAAGGLARQVGAGPRRGSGPHGGGQDVGGQRRLYQGYRLVSQGHTSKHAQKWFLQWIYGGKNIAMC
jgi:hypothetical protein